MGYKKRYRRSVVNRDKYSVEHTAIVLSTPATGAINGLYQNSQVICAPTATQGMRKVKHLTISLVEGSDIDSVALWWAIVFVPEGYTPRALNGQVGQSFYEPNQFVLSSGVIDPTAGPIRIRSPLSRNLNSGDSLYLVIGTAAPSITVQGVCKYAITLQ